MVKKIALLGASGSIGTSTFKVVAEQRDRLQISIAQANSNYTLLLDKAIEFGIKYSILSGIGDKALQDKIRKEYPQLKIYFGHQELIRILRDEDYDIGLNAIGGSAGIEATFAILERGKRLALANKESLVMGGHLVKNIAKEGQIIPVDSEHSALFQAMQAGKKEEIRKLIITASGGAFRTRDLSTFADITPAMALKHPNWEMGAKITLDSATMFNKALEVIEAHWLFDMPYDRIEAVIHPQSFIHSLLQYIDGSIIAQMGYPDMMLPILYALSYPERYQSDLVKTDLLNYPDLNFEKIERERYPLYFLGVEVGEKGGILPTVMNAAVEAAMQLFLKQKIRFTEIYKVVYDAVNSAKQIENPGLESIIMINKAQFESSLSKYS